MLAWPHRLGTVARVFLFLSADEAKPLLTGVGQLCFAPTGQRTADRAFSPTRETLIAARRQRGDIARPPVLHWTNRMR